METKIPLKCHFSIILPYSGKISIMWNYGGIIMGQNNGILMEFSAQNTSSKIQTTWKFNFFHYMEI